MPAQIFEALSFVFWRLSFCPSKLSVSMKITAEETFSV